MVDASPRSLRAAGAHTLRDASPPAERDGSDHASEFWAKLRRLTIPPGPPAPMPRPIAAWLADFRRLLACRGSAETVAMQRRVARLAADRIQAVCAEEFAAIFSDGDVAVIVREALTDLFDGGLASFRGSSDRDLVQFVEDRADRVLLRAAVAEWTDHEARICWRSRYGSLLTSEEADEAAAEAVDQLLHRALAGFRGGSPAELYGFARVVASRTVSRIARHRSRDRSSLAMLRVWEHADLLVGAAPPPSCSAPAALPLSDADRSYLESLFAVRGSKAELARQLGVGRSAVTRMVQRIMTRIDELPDSERDQVGRWARHTFDQIEHLRGQLPT